MKNNTLHRFFYLFLILSTLVLAPAFKQPLAAEQPSFAEQMAITNICEVAQKTGDLQTIKLTSEKMLKWSGISDPQLVSKIIECLKLQFKDPVYNADNGSFSNENTKKRKFGFNKKEADTKMLKNWINFIKNNKLGNSEDFFIQKKTNSRWESVGVIMGFDDDWTACQIIISSLVTANKEFRCIPGN